MTRRTPPLLCGFCGRPAGPDRPLAPGPGVAICAGCAADAVAAVGPSPPGAAPPAPRPGWARGGVDRAALAALPPADLAAEVETVLAVLAPLDAFVDAAGEVFGVDIRARARERCHHCDPVALPDGTVVWAASFDRAAPYDRDVPPDWGLYLDARWSPPWPHAHVDWPDFGVPEDRAALLAVLAALLDRARDGERVEVGCAGGHGRTGTALACLAVLAGTDAADAVAWVRSAYCERAVETADQAALVSRDGPAGRSDPPPPGPH